MIDNITIDELTLDDLLRCADAGDMQELERQIELATRRTHNTAARGEELTETDRLLDEALWYVRAGDLSEAIYRLKQAQCSYEFDRQDEDEDEYA